MMITVHLSDGRKITKDDKRLAWFNPMNGAWAVPEAEEGKIILNMLHVMDIRPADEMEKKHAELHGW